MSREPNTRQRYNDAERDTQRRLARIERVQKYTTQADESQHQYYRTHSRSRRRRISVNQILYWLTIGNLRSAQNNPKPWIIGFLLSFPAFFSTKDYVIPYFWNFITNNPQIVFDSFRRIIP